MINLRGVLLMLRSVLLVLVLSNAQPVTAQEVVTTDAGPARISQVVGDLDTPWAFGFLPGGAMLVTERPGRLLYIAADGSRHEIVGLPEIAARGQGGLLDLLIPLDFSRNREIFLTFSEPHGRTVGTAVLRARLSDDNRHLRNTSTIFRMSEFSDLERHFGSRLAEAPDRTLFVTIGERGDRPSAQDLQRHNGSIVHITRDGGPAPGNPDLGADTLPEIWSFGHRNPQGLAFDLNGQLWAIEHGARGGDELNRIRKGANYGWPVIAYGRHYSGLPIGEGTHKPGMEQPEFYWDPSIAPSGMTFYSGRLWPEWRGDLFVGSLKFDYISRLEGSPLREAEQIQTPQAGRVRDVREAPDGSLFFLSVDTGALYRITPAQ
ncbi:PQQ-dependent sugar dehydrogenase [Pseudohalocynthiibacter sp. F2068]|jgi:aldose sugar dehydrogenase|uniref:PQQ-dependent sugar dehydrogenase n=1 Tax=Pseudohalocynthiibacter sp. F2068 TaxID=2926418 RepID=UPI001FF4409F|nr:PQQ-dependent sugar dehydrogenase [Pseudohalocynthiibacter sp. F2068]MCK0104458.1 PQQ-dependent sugar dehydrogenase [Pseudohalocynthiibacter sp. F2068]